MPGDFFDYVQDQTRSPGVIASAIAGWSATASGLDLKSEEVQATIAARRLAAERRLQ
jgi:hypothetical protein